MKGGCFCSNVYMLNKWITYNELSEGALQGVAEALRLAAQLLGLGREASPSAVANSMKFYISTYIVRPPISLNKEKGLISRSMTFETFLHLGCYFSFQAN